MPEHPVEPKTCAARLRRPPSRLVQGKLRPTLAVPVRRLFRLGLQSGDDLHGQRLQIKARGCREAHLPGAMDERQKVDAVPGVVVIPLVPAAVCGDCREKCRMCRRPGLVGRVEEDLLPRPSEQAGRLDELWLVDPKTREQSFQRGNGDRRQADFDQRLRLKAPDGGVFRLDAVQCLG